MHMADALVSPAVAGTMYVLSAGAATYSIKKIANEENDKKVPLMGVMGAFIFATQMINFSIPGTGSSGHLSGGLLLSAFLGPYAGFLTMIVILGIQALLFADGGILALGCNIWNMAFYSCFFGYFCIYRTILNKKYSKARIFIASIIGSVLSLQLGAFSVTLQTLASGISELPFGVFVMAMQPIHLVIGVVEGLITATVLTFVYEARPELLITNSLILNNKMSFKRIIAILSIVTVFIGGGLSLVASSSPDGLEWSILKVSGNEAVEADGEIHKSVAEFQKNISLLPDYSFKNSQEEIAGVSFSGIIGSIIVMGVSIGVCSISKSFRKKKS